MSGLELEHYSGHPFLGPVEDRAQQESANHYNKPRGLWLSVRGEFDWPWWCRSEGFQIEQLSHCARFELASGHRILIISSPEQLLAFGEVFGVENRFGRSRIDWLRAADQYDGVIISPYQWELRLDDRVPWYYGWDCASGCVWKGDALVRVYESLGAAS